MENPDKDKLEKWHQDPNNWVWGVFYFNKEDKRLLVPKRFKWMGWTINFANPKSVLFFVLLLAFFLFVLFIIETKN